LVSQEGPGPGRWSGPLPAEFYLSAADITDDLPPAGQIVCQFACFSAGTPERDEFAHGARTKPGRIAPQPFVAALPQRLLAHPEGGALAVIGHVDRAWGYSFFWRHLGRQAQAFEALFETLIDGYPVGAAMESFGDRFSALAVELAAAVEAREYGGRLDADKIRTLWSVHNDAKCYALLGDPAVQAAV
jgi:Peptidase family C25